MRVSGCNGHYKIVLDAGAKVEERSDETPPWRGKNRDKQLTHIVRVMLRHFLENLSVWVAAFIFSQMCILFLQNFEEQDLHFQYQLLVQTLFAGKIF